ncbi:portal protein [Gordonia phage Evaa]|nr:portal protein [Gordonia phage Evaa]
MAAPELRIVRRPRGGVSRRSLTAASAPVDNPEKSFKSSMGGSRDDWQNKAWDMLDLVGELRYYVGWRASSCSRVRLIPSELDEETGLPTGTCDDQRVREIAKMIAGGPLGQAQLIRRAVECLTVPGETWIAVIYPPDSPPEGTWLSLTRDEITTRQGKVEIELPDADKPKHVFNKGTDSLFRVWNPKPRRAKEADSPVRATMDSLTEIVRTTKTIRNASKSRLIGNGVVFVPHEMSLPSSNAPVAAGKPGDPVPNLVGTPAVAQLQNLLFQVATAAYDDEDSLAALIPMFAGVPGDQVKNVSHLKFDNTVTDTAIKLRNDAIARLAMGLDVTPERLLGIGSNTNHWSAWQIGDDDVRLHISPPMELICQAITDQLFRKVLEREGIDAGKFVLWYDPAALTADPDLTDEATAAFDRGAITAEAYRAFLGLGDTGYDLTNLKGWQDWAKDRVAHKPELLQSLLPLLAELEGEIEAPAPPPAVEAPSEDEGDEGDDEGNEEEPDTENDEPEPGDTAAAERAVVSVMVSRALELAGKRRRTRSDHARLRDVPVHDTHRYMEPVQASEVPTLIKGWDAALEDDVLESLGIDSARLRAAVRRQVRDELTRQVVAG